MKRRWSVTTSKSLDRWRDGFSLIELLVVLAIIAAVAGLVTMAVSQTMREQQSRQCLTNMLMIEAAKDEYMRDHLGQANIDPQEFQKYFRFGVPTCPLNSGQPYANWDNLNAAVGCVKHPLLESKIPAR